MNSRPFFIVRRSIHLMIAWVVTVLLLFCFGVGLNAGAGPAELAGIPYSRVFAISDVHGMYPALIRLLTRSQVIDSNLHWSAGNSLFLVVGDSIDKGPQSIEVLDFWMRLQAEAALANGRLVHLLGNHEAEFLADPSNSKAAVLLAELRVLQHDRPWKPP